MRHTRPATAVGCELLYSGRAEFSAGWRGRFHTGSGENPQAAEQGLRGRQCVQAGAVSILHPRSSSQEGISSMPPGVPPEKINMPHGTLTAVLVGVGVR